MNVPLDCTRLPHQARMRWIRSASRIAENEIVAEAVLPEECGPDGSVSPLLGIEVLAQTAGVCLANEPGTSGQSSEGRLLQVRAANWDSANRRPLGTSVRAKVRHRESSAIGLHQFTGELSLQSGTVVLQADFSLLVHGETRENS